MAVVVRVLKAGGCRLQPTFCTGLGELGCYRTGYRVRDCMPCPVCYLRGVIGTLLTASRICRLSCLSECTGCLYTRLLGYPKARSPVQ